MISVKTVVGAWQTLWDKGALMLMCCLFQLKLLSEVNVWGSLNIDKYHGLLYIKCLRCCWMWDLDSNVIIHQPQPFYKMYLSELCARLKYRFSIHHHCDVLLKIPSTSNVEMTLYPKMYEFSPCLVVWVSFGVVFTHILCTFYEMLYMYP